MHLYVIGHGQSVGNTGVDMPDPVLTDAGHEQTRLTGEEIRD